MSHSPPPPLPPVSSAVNRPSFHTFRRPSSFFSTVHDGPNYPIKLPNFQHFFSSNPIIKSHLIIIIIIISKKKLKIKNLGNGWKLLDIVVGGAEWTNLGLVPTFITRGDGVTKLTAGCVLPFPLSLFLISHSIKLQILCLYKYKNILKFFFFSPFTLSL